MLKNSGIKYAYDSKKQEYTIKSLTEIANWNWKELCRIRKDLFCPKCQERITCAFYSGEPRKFQCFKTFPDNNHKTWCEFYHIPVKTIEKKTLKLQNKQVILNHLKNLVVANLLKNQFSNQEKETTTQLNYYEKIKDPITKKIVWRSFPILNKKINAASKKENEEKYVVYNGKTKVLYNESEKPHIVCKNDFENAKQIIHLYFQEDNEILNIARQASMKSNYKFVTVQVAFLCKTKITSIKTDEKNQPTIRIKSVIELPEYFYYQIVRSE
ncbi:MAG: hypothetical protein LBC44_03135 [Mycoplasmataceae bacterium]|nr:hypothetical protein [Mycoplasmataceae bacterium]